MWLALRFVHWALDCRIASQAVSTAPATLVVETRAQRQRVVAASRAALAAGVCQDMGLADARLRVPDAGVHERDKAQEQAAMARLAGWAWGYSSQLHWAIADDDIECTRLIMEIGASLRLFGGRKKLLARLRDDLAGMGHRYRAGLGTTPQAALAFARAERRLRRDQAIEALPLACLDLAADVQATLAASGISRAGELLALPPSTLARRFGPRLLADLACLKGSQPHGLALYRLPPRYDTHHELTGAVEQTQGLVFVLRRVFDELARFLRGADSMIQTLRVVLVHEHESPTRIVLRLSAPTHDARHLERIAGQRLERTTLVAPVVGIGLVSDRLRRARHEQQGFWHHDGARRSRDDWPATLDRLRARLGQDAVYWLHAPADHRPDHASVGRDHPPTDADNGEGQDPLPRPLWLLDCPQPVPAVHLDRLVWISGPERIESGWWQAGERRDYYRARDERGRLLWIFRELDSARSPTTAPYYIQGLFG